MSTYNLHTGHQSAYEQNFSIETALCALMNHMLWSMEQGEVCILVALDLRAAFDTVDHTILFDVLHQNYFIKDNTLKWIQSYLKDRKLHVQVKYALSSVKCFNYSVPHESCLGPILFTMYSSIITECINSEQDLGSYADDHYIRDVLILERVMVRLTVSDVQRSRW